MWFQSKPFDLRPLPLKKTFTFGNGMIVISFKKVCILVFNVSGVIYAKNEDKKICCEKNQRYSKWKSKDQEG